MASRSLCVPTAVMRPSSSKRDPVGEQDGGRAVRDHERGRRRQHAAQRRLDLRLGVHVQRRERVVEHQHPRAAQHGAGEREPLPLTAGQRQALLADPGVEPERQVVDELGLRNLERLDHVVLGDAGPAEGEVLAHACREQRGVLERGRHRVPQLIERQVAHVDTADEDATAGDVVQPGHERGQRGLAAADCADQRHRLAGLDVQVDAAQHLGGRVVVVEPDVVEHQRGSGLGGHRVVGVEDGRLRVEHLEDADGGRARLLGEGEQPAEADDRPDQLQVQRQERDQLTQRHRVVRDRHHAAPDHAGEDQLRRAFEHRPEPAERADLAQLGAAQPLRVAGEHREHVRATSVGLDHPDAERGLFDRGRQVTGQVLGAARLSAVAQLEAACGQHERRHRDEDEQAERDVDVDQQAEHDQRDRRVDDQEHEREADEAAQCRQVGGQPRQQLARGPAVVEGDRQPLHVGEQVAPDVGLDVDRGPRHGEAAQQEAARLGDAEREGEPDQRPQAGRVVMADRPVDHGADHERDECLAQHPDQGEDEHRRDRPAVGPRPPAQPQQRLDRMFGVVLLAGCGSLGEVGHVDLRYDEPPTGATEFPGSCVSRACGAPRAGCRPTTESTHGRPCRRRTRRRGGPRRGR